MIQSGAAALTLILPISDGQSLGIPAQSFALNDQTLPLVVSSVIPALSGYSWAAGTVFHLTFGTLSAQDSAWLASLSATTGTLTLYVPSSGWRRISGQINWTSPTLTLTLAQTAQELPWVTPI